MAGWKKYFTVYETTNKSRSDSHGLGASRSNNLSWLPEIYAGSSTRTSRYHQYDIMDQDGDINTALDILSEFSAEVEDGSPFIIHTEDGLTETEMDLLEVALSQWISINDFDSRAFRTIRHTLKYGDQFYIRDPETYVLYWIDPATVDKIVINEADGKAPYEYHIRNLDLNLITKVGTQITELNIGEIPDRVPLSNITTMPQHLAGMTQSTLIAVAAEHILHISLASDDSPMWPFGTSILESVYKSYKQKEMLEDSVLIYRVQRAPERRVFYVDVGDMPRSKAMAYLEQVKNEINQKRIPSKTGGDESIIDATYNPMCLSLDTTVPLLDGRTLTIAELAKEYESGKENWTYSCDQKTGEIKPGNITWAGTTRKDAQVIKLTFDDGTELICTPDHKIPVMGKGFVEAQHLAEDDSLISFNSRKQSLSTSSSDRSYTQVYDHAANEWVYTHRMVGSFFRDVGKHQEFTYLEENVGAHKSIIHHKDYNRYNDDPRNLQWMNKTDHIKYHQETNISEEESDRIRAKISTSVKQTEFNHRVAKIEWLNDTMDVGTLTIDGAERWHTHHTFPVNDSIFVKNSMMEDYFFAQTSDSRGSRVEILPGGDQLGEIDDLKYFDTKMQRALRIPEGYMPRNEQTGASYNDGRVGTAYIQEYRFVKYCKRLQQFVQKPLDREFKMFIKHRGITIASGSFELRFNEPQNFSKYRQIEVDSQQIGAYNQINDNKHISKRFAMKRYLGWTDAEILENERMLQEELPEDRPIGDEEGDFGGGFGGPSMGTAPVGDFEGEDFETEFDEMGLGDEGEIGGEGEEMEIGPADEEV